MTGVRVGRFPGMAIEVPRILPVTAAQLLGPNGWETPPGYPTVDLGKSYVGNGSTTPETSILNAGAATSGLFIPAAVKDFWTIRLRGSWFNNSGTSTYTSRLRVYFGAYTIYDQTSQQLTSNATLRQWGVDLLVLLETLGAAGTGTLRVGVRDAGVGGLLATNAGIVSMVGTGGYREQIPTTTGTSASPALITNAAQDFNVTALHSNASALITTALAEATVCAYPQNR